MSAKRISGDKERINENYSSIQEAALRIVERKKSEVKRYKFYYNADCLDFTNYDLIIDTTEISPYEVCDIIIKEFEKFNTTEKEYKRKAFICPKNLYPTKTSDKESIVEITNNNSFDYIIKGHNLVANSIRADRHLIEVEYSNTNITPDRELIDIWQKTNDFKYLIEP